MKKRLMMALACMLLSLGTVLAQNQIKGSVISSEDGHPVIGATIKVVGTNNGTVTDANGQFSLSVRNGAQLEVSYVGMVTKKVNAAPNMKIELSSDNMLDEVMVVAYGTQKKSTFTGSAATLKSDAIEKRQVSNITNALAGSVAGVQATSNNGQPGTSATIRVRGFGSINAGMAPLYVVDGIAYDGDISAINSQDIESMSVLKDAAAAALYGARGANGVILINTKKGKTNQEAKVSLEARWGANSRGIKNYDVYTSTSAYMEKLYESRYNNAIYNLGYSPASARTYANSQLQSALGYPVYTDPNGEGIIGVDGKINPNVSLGYSDGEYYYTPDDWSKAMFSNELRQEYNLNVTGGTDKLSYYFSAGYLSDDGVIKNSGFDRLSTRLNVDYQAKKWLKLGANIAYTNSTSKYPGEQTIDDDTSSGNAFFVANNIAPVYPIYARYADGSIMYSDSGKPVYDYGDRTTGNYTRNFMSISNPLGDLTYRTEEYLMDIFNSKWYAVITPIEGLTITANLGLSIDNTRFHYASSSKYGQSASYGGEAVQEHDRVYGFTQQYIANYKKRFNKHGIDLMAGFESYEYNSEMSEAYGQNLYKEGDWAVNNTIDQRRGYGSVGKYATGGFISRLNYDYNEKYFATVSYRRDGSSRFSEDHRWGNFWSLSAAWDMAKESFIPSEWIEMLKLKASFGQQGNDNIGNNYAYLDQYTVTGSDGVFSDGTLAYKGNPDLTWETTNAFNVGVDFSLWCGKLSGTLEYFSRQTKDMLYNKPVATSNGYSSIPMNVGSMRNSGLEIDLQSEIIKTSDITWAVNANITLPKNKIVELHADLEGEWISGSRIFREGESMYQYYLVKYAGVDKTNGLALYWAKDADDNEYATSDWQVAYNTNRQGTGDLLPKAYGGFGTTLSAYGFDLSVQCAYQLGGKIFDSGYQGLMHAGSSSDAGRNWHTDIANAWTIDNPNSSIPRIASTDQYTNSTSDRWLVSSNYLSLNNITLGYTIPRSLTNVIGLESLRLYGVADNLALFSARKGLDPRQSFTTATTSIYTALRTISFGVKVTF